MALISLTFSNETSGTDVTSVQLLSQGNEGTSMLLRTCFITLATISILSACSATSEGVALGIRGSPAWNKTAPKADIVAYYDQKRDYELCSSWQRHPDAPTMRRNIADALERRGQPADKCYNPELDAMQAAAEASRPNSYVPPPAAPRMVSCTSSRFGNWVSTNCI